ncbi:hypothetical protein [Cryptosporangium sp. NPDC048952]|uniref:hypothetical protein n=1 Tax=Cryptosporangium sp. NPDC048952 TaxID=3363961 RepID=UPI00372004FB
MRRLSLLILLVGAALLPAQAASAAVTVTPIALPSLADVPNQLKQALDVNAAGVIVGSSPGYTSGGVPTLRPVSWQDGTAIDVTPLSAFAGQATAVNLAGDIGMVVDGGDAYVRSGDTTTRVAPPNSVGSQVLDLNERGQALIAWRDENQTGLTGGYHLSIWFQGTFTAVTPTGQEAAPQSNGEIRAFLNTRGQVVSLFRRAGGGIATAKVWSAGRLTTIGTGISRIGAMSERGEVVGTRTVLGVGRPFSWRNGRLTSLPGIGTANAVNEIGQVVGSVRAANGSTHAALWTSGRLTDLGTLGGTTAVATSINSHGQIVGTSGHAFVWWRGAFTDMTPGATSSGATKITDTGYVIGSETDNQGTTVAAAWKVG